MKVQWFGSNILEICSFIGRDISGLLVDRQLFVPTEKGIRPVPIGAYIQKNGNGTFSVVS